MSEKDWLWNETDWKEEYEEVTDAQTEWILSWQHMNEHGLWKWGWQMTKTELIQGWGWMNENGLLRLATIRIWWQTIKYELVLNIKWW